MAWGVTGWATGNEKKKKKNPPSAMRNAPWAVAKGSVGGVIDENFAHATGGRGVANNEQGHRQHGSHHYQ